MTGQQVYAAIYARYSSHNQGEQSIEAQLSEGHKYAAAKGYTVVHEYVDRAQSGRTDQRTEFQRMLRDLPKKAFSVLILWKVDRFGRNREEIAINKARCKRYGVHPEYVAECIPDTPEGVVLESVLEGFAEYYSLQLAQNVKRGRRASAEKCQSVGGPTPIGYRIGANKQYELDPDKSKVVKFIFDQYAAGATMKEISDDLNRKGIRSTSGRLFSVDSIRRILGNEKYTGTYILGEYRVENGIPAIVSQDVWEKVKATMAKNKKGPNHKWSRSDYLLVGKTVCGYCGAQISGASGHSATGAKYGYYACTCQRKKHACNLKAIRKDVLEGFVMKAVNSLLDDDQLLEWIADKAFEILEESNKEMDLTESVKARIKDVERSIGNILKAIESGAYSPTMNTRLLDLETEKGQLMDELASIEASKALRITRDHILYYLYQMRKNKTESREGTQRLIDTFVNRVFVTNEQIAIHLNHTSDHNTITYSDFQNEKMHAQESSSSRAMVERCTKKANYSILIITVKSNAAVIIEIKRADLI